MWKDLGYIRQGTSSLTFTFSVNSKNQFQTAERKGKWNKKIKASRFKRQKKPKKKLYCCSKQKCPTGDRETLTNLAL